MRGADVRSAAMRDLSLENDKLRRILDVTRRMASTPDLETLLTMIIDATCEVLECERATIFLYDRAADELFSSVARGLECIRFPADRGIAGAAAMSRKPVNVPDAYADARFNREVDRKTGFRTRNLLTLPLENLSGELTGVLQALNKAGGPFEAADEELATVLSAQAGVALDRGRLIEEYADKRRMQRDLDIARSIQQGLFPKTHPRISGYEIIGWNRSADETGGDCFDFYPLRDGRLAIFMADATGHGIGAALVVAQCRSLLRALLSVSNDLQEIATTVNNLLSEDLADDRFVTAFFGVLDPRAHVLDYISAGQGPLLMLGAAAPDVRAASALPFAVMPESDFSERARFEFAPGATVALLTDGFYESTNPDGEQFGEERVVRHFSARANVGLERVMSDLLGEVEHFIAGAKQADDLTAVLVRRVEA